MDEVTSSCLKSFVQPGEIAAGRTYWLRKLRGHLYPSTPLLRARLLECGAKSKCQYKVRIQRSLFRLKFARHLYLLLMMTRCMLVLTDLRNCSAFAWQSRLLPATASSGPKSFLQVCVLSLLHQVRNSIGSCFLIATLTCSEQITKIMMVFTVYTCCLVFGKLVCQLLTLSIITTYHKTVYPLAPIVPCRRHVQPGRAARSPAHSCRRRRCPVSDSHWRRRRCCEPVSRENYMIHL